MWQRVCDKHQGWENGAFWLLRGFFFGGWGRGGLFHFILSKTVDGVVVVNRNICMNIKIMLDCITPYLDHQRFSRI